MAKKQIQYDNHLSFALMLINYSYLLCTIVLYYQELSFHRWEYLHRHLTIIIIVSSQVDTERENFKLTRYWKRKFQTNFLSLSPSLCTYIYIASSSLILSILLHFLLYKMPLYLNREEKKNYQICIESNLYICPPDVSPWNSTDH